MFFQSMLPFGILVAAMGADMPGKIRLEFESLATGALEGSLVRVNTGM